MKEFLRNNKKNFWFWAYLIVAVATLIALPIMSLDAGNTGDEDQFQIPQGKNVINYFKTHGEDTTCLNFQGNLQYYGSSFDIVTEFINQTFHIEDINISRHICNSLLGWLAILMVGLIAYQFGGFRAGVFAMILLFLSPRFLGHSFNNPKDIPFATAIISAIFSMILFFKQFPKVKWYTYVILVFSIAFSISVRIGGLILFGYFGLLGLVYLIVTFANEKKMLNLSNKKTKVSFFDCISWKNVFKMLWMGLGICIVGYFMGLLLWPYALQSPIKNPIEAFRLMAGFDTSIRQVFEGAMLWSDKLPWYYTPKYILITIPIAVILGLILFFVFCWRKKENRFGAFILFFTFFFPIFWIVYTRANVYGGWRHAIFAYPPMVAAAGWGFSAIFQWLEEKCSKIKAPIMNIGSLVVLLVLLISPIRFIFANHPYEYTYFNGIVGGTKNALGNYELDYYYNSMREASEWIIANAEKPADGSKIKVASWHTASTSYFFRKDTANFQIKFARWYERESVDWDYAIFTVTGINPEHLRSKEFPPKNTIKTIDVDGVPIALILKRKDKNDYLAIQAKLNHQYDSAKIFAFKSLQKDPGNPGALITLAEIYCRQQQPDSSLFYINKYLKYDSQAEAAHYLKSYSYLLKNDIPTAIRVIKSSKAYNVKYAPIHYLAIQIYMQQQDFISAKKEFEELIELEMVDNEFVTLWLAYNRAQGIDENTAYAILYKKVANTLESHGKKKQAEEYRKLYS